jgi:Na+-transporting NADH:ubiquinone oxidoreductase subunit NqrC
VGLNVEKILQEQGKVPGLGGEVKNASYLKK